MIEMDAKTQISEDKGSQTNFIFNSSAAFSAMIEFPSIYRIRSDAVRTSVRYYMNLPSHFCLATSNI